ncbi:MAG: 4-phosphopantoate--beta-alanine ligase [Candidatus Planktophila sp.]|nr:4-phosphopantoate--beta-alanine ligase [Candidatus Planktophila sp.]
MKIVANSSEIDGGCTFVPTMGALHAGHVSLFKLAKAKSDFVVASIFINPLQFDDAQDLANYPRTPDLDIEIAADSGVTHLWLPQQGEIYPSVFKKFSAGELGNIYEGANRSGHFDGVVTVVSRLFELLKPETAIFGEKDFQQLTLIRAIAKGVKIIAAPTVREADGLAVSSRNVRLDEDSRAAASVIYKALIAAEISLNAQEARSQMRKACATQPLFNLDYAEVIDEDDFSIATDSTLNSRAIIAGWLNGVRLIDNMQMKTGGLR